ncbi:putative retrotransposon gag protein [Neofusicoccum parvum]|uniref:Retrotransposon gag protein n=1 Tax=Neofusicoccum parvum TaxID=310453 RepID=A0ACB5SEU1_9PEZI|nr:putative retrotransposon gag protein [Neofusicoccum parvum]
MDRRRTNRWFEKKSGYQVNTNKPRRERTTLEEGDTMALDAASRQDSKKSNNNKHDDKKPKGPNPNWTDEQKQRWTACFNDNYTTHQSDKDATGWYPRKPRGLAMLTRNEEVLDLNDIIESFPHDDEIVNSENGEFYDSTEAEEDSSNKKDLVEPGLALVTWQTKSLLKIT